MYVKHGGGCVCRCMLCWHKEHFAFQVATNDPPNKLLLLLGVTDNLLGAKAGIFSKQVSCIEGEFSCWFSFSLVIGILVATFEFFITRYYFPSLWGLWLLFWYIVQCNFVSLYFALLYIRFCDHSLSLLH